MCQHDRSRCRGANGSNQLGDGTGTPYSSTPTQVAGNVSLAAISAGRNFMVGLQAGNAAASSGNAPASLWEWGDSGGETSDFGARTPILVDNASALDVQQFDAGWQHACLISSDGSLWCWGANESGVLGPDQGPSAVPVEQPTGGRRFSQVSAGGVGYTYFLSDGNTTFHDYSYTCALDTSGAAWCWGDNNDGQLGRAGHVASPTIVPVEGNRSFAFISAGGTHTCSIEDGTRGDNAHGQLGSGSGSNEAHAPVQVLGSGRTYSNVTAGFEFNCALDSNGTPWCFGTNTNGQLGAPPANPPAPQGSMNYSSAPVQANNLTFQSLSAGGDYVCGLSVPPASPTAAADGGGSPAGASGTGAGSGGSNIGAIVGGVVVGRLRQGGSGAGETSSGGGSRGMPQMVGRVVTVSRVWELDWNRLMFIGPIGEGSFGKARQQRPFSRPSRLHVYLAKWQGTQAAVKVLLAPERTSYADSLKLPPSLLRQLQEVSFFGICLTPAAAIVTEYCALGSLSAVLRKGREDPAATSALTCRRRLSLVRDAALGMAYLHSRAPPIIHRDLKSTNLLVDEHFTCKVADFKWMAPELLEGRGATLSSDVFAFGVVLWELLTWTMPWSGEEDNIFMLPGHIMSGGRPVVPPRDQLPGPDDAWFEGLDAYIVLMERCEEELFWMGPMHVQERSGARASTVADLQACRGTGARLHCHDRPTFEQIAQDLE
eukprot:scaffold15.g4358.t1